MTPKSKKTTSTIDVTDILEVLGQNNFSNQKQIELLQIINFRSGLGSKKTIVGLAEFSSVVQTHCSCVWFNFCPLFVLALLFAVIPSAARNQQILL